MSARALAGRSLLAASLLWPLAPARAANPMGYQLLASTEAAALPRNHGALGLDVDRGQQITDDGMTFDIMRVKTVRRGSPAAQVGFQPGDQIIAMDGRVFPTIASFAAYVGSLQPGSQASIDYMPAGTGPQQAQRVSVRMGGAGAPPPKPEEAGMSTRTKVAIGVGAVALLGCYELGCFSRRKSVAPARPGQAQPIQAQPTQARQ